MSKVYIYAAGAFLAGLATGALTAWKFANEKAQRDLEEKLKSVKDDYKELYSRIMITDESPEKDNPEDTSENFTEKDRTEYESFAGNYNPNSKKVDYTSYSSSDKTPEEPADEKDEDDPDIYRNDPSRPRVITAEEYYDEPDMNKISICLFEDDENPVLTDDVWDPLEEPYKVITKEDLEEFLAQDDDDEIFTVCEARNCMYSIEKQGQNWGTFLKHNPIIIETGY